MDIVIHALANGATVLVTSPGHGFKFSDGTVAQPQNKAVADALSLKREFRAKGEVRGMNVTESVNVIADESLAFLRKLVGMADIVLVPFMLVDALQKQGVRDQFPSVLAFNSTAETSRSAPADKIVDVNNWAY